jgi:CheY-like chemotaxis protein
MTHILIIESHPEVRRLLERMVCRLGHEPVIATAPAMPLLQDIELVIVEPSDPASALLAEQVQLSDPLLPIICASVFTDPQVDVAFSSCLLKPFTVDDLAAAIMHALRQSHEQPHATAGAAAPAEGDLAA